MTLPVALDGPISLRSNKGRNPMLRTDVSLKSQLVDDLADRVLRDPEFLVQLVKAGDGITRLVLAIPDAAAQLIGELLPAGAVGLPDDLPIHLFDHGGDGRASCHCPPKQGSADKILLQHATAWHSNDQALRVAP